jgi:hypothetical protein
MNPNFVRDYLAEYHYYTFQATSSFTSKWTLVTDDAAWPDYMASHLENVYGKMGAITLSGYCLTQKSSITRNNFQSITIVSRGSVVVKVLRDRFPVVSLGIFSVVPSDKTMCRLSLWKWVPGISRGVKAAGAYGWRHYHPCSAERRDDLVL